MPNIFLVFQKKFQNISISYAHDELRSRQIFTEFSKNALRGITVQIYFLWVLHKFMKNYL